MIRFTDHAWEALDAHQARAATIAQYEGIVNRWLIPALGARPLGDITAQHVDTLVADVRARRSDSWAQNVLICLRVVMQKAVLWRRITANPCDGISVKTPAADFTVLTPEQRELLDAELAATDYQAEEALLRVLLWTGLRLGEALALRHDDFDLNTKTLRVRKSKTPSGLRRVDIPDCLVNLLSNHCKSSGRRLPIFYGLEATRIRRRLTAACARAGVPRLRVHDLRHTRVTTLLLAGVPVGYVSKQVGHASPAFTLKVYDHWASVASAEERRRWANS